MNKKKIQLILRKQHSLFNLSQEQLKLLNSKTEDITDFIKANIKKQKLKADIFVGGSFAKKTIIKKEKYDIDIFVRFDKQYQDNEISNLLSKIIPKRSQKIHGSRDYFKLKLDENLEFEVIPTLKVLKPQEAENITDLSFFHVSYVNEKLRNKKNKKLADEIKLAKSFVHASYCYGAESYINGFSGYALELLIIHYKSFLNFIKAIASLKDNKNNKDNKLIIDQEKLYKNKEEIMREVNESKLLGPIVLIDPTFKERNVLAALSQDTFDKFKQTCINFLKHPSENYFKIKDLEADFKQKNKNNKDVIEIILTTNKQAGDIAGTKMKKFSNYFLNSAKRYLDIKLNLFVYNETVNTGKVLLIARAKKEIFFPGPPIKMKEQLRKFKNLHKKVQIKTGKAFAVEKNPFSTKDFIYDFKLKNEQILGQMEIKDMKIL